MPRNISGTIYRRRGALETGSSSFVYKTDDLKESDELDNLVNFSEKAIFEASSIFPFDLFPNSISIYANRITVTYKSLMFKDEYPLLIESVIGARVTHGAVFATLSIETFGYEHRPYPLRFLKSSDARTARRYILALIECKKNGIDLAKYDISELKEKLKSVGKVHEHV